MVRHRHLHAFPVGGNLNKAVLTRALKAPAARVVIYVSAVVNDVEYEHMLLRYVALQLREKAHACGVELVLREIADNDVAGGGGGGAISVPLDWAPRRLAIEQCFAQSAAIFFVSLQSDAYGPCQLPKDIDKNSFEFRRRQLQKREDRDLLDNHYALDSNAVPPVYTLRASSTGASEVSIKELLKDVVFDPRYGDGGLVIGRSTCEYEVQTAISICHDHEVPVHRHLRWFRRKGGGSRVAGAAAAASGRDQGEALKTKNLLAAMQGALHADAADEPAVREFVIPATHEQEDDWRSAHLKRFGTAVKVSLTNCLQELAASRGPWLQHGTVLGVEPGVLDEMAFHARVADDESSNCVGRDAELAEALRLLGASVRAAPANESSVHGPTSPSAGAAAAAPDGDGKAAIGGEGVAMDVDDEEEWDEDLAGYYVDEQARAQVVDPCSVKGVALAVVGKCGSGKTAFMARLARTLCDMEGAPAKSRPVPINVVRADTDTPTTRRGAGTSSSRGGSGSPQPTRQDRPYRPVVVRFCGLTRDSSSGLALVRSLCHELRLLVSEASDVWVTDGAPPPPGVPLDYAEAVATLHEQLRTLPCILVLDGLDRLDDEDLARSKISFLRGAHPHADTRIIVSAEADEPLALALPDSARVSNDEEEHAIHELFVLNRYFGCDTTLQASSVPRVTLPDFDTGYRPPPAVVVPEAMSPLLVTQRDPSSPDAGSPSPSTTTSVKSERRLSNKAALSQKSSDKQSSLKQAQKVAAAAPPDDDAMDGAAAQRAAAVAAADAATRAATAEALEAAALAFEGSEAGMVLTALLRSRGRALTPEQMQYVGRQVCDQPCTALLLHLVACVTSTFRSFDAVGPRLPPLPPSLDALGFQLLEELEHTHGEALTRAACGFVTWARHGVSDGEMEDLLSLHADVMDSVHGLGSEAHDDDMTEDDDEFSVRRVPVAMWVRLRAALAPLVAERADGCLRWRNRGMQAVAERRYGRPAEVQVLKAIMGRYFGDAVDPAKIASRGIARQPLVIDRGLNPDGAAVPTDVWSAGLAELNLRRFDEGIAHMVDADLLKEAVKELCRLEYLLGRFKARVGRAVVSYFPPLLEKLTAACAHDNAQHTMAAVAVRAQHYFRWMLEDRDLLHRSPDMLVASGTRQALTSLARKDVEMQLAATGGGSLSTVERSPLVRCRALGGRAELRSLVAFMRGHGGPVTAVTWSPCGTRVASASADRTARVWDAVSGLPLRILDGHTDAVLCVDWCVNSHMLATGSKDCTVGVWDASAGTLSCALKGHTGAVTSVCWSGDGRNLASGSADHSILLWHVINGGVSGRVTATLLGYTKTMEGHCWTINALAYSPDKARLLAGSSDNVIRVWNVRKEVELAAFDDHREKVLGVGWHPDGVVFASGSADRHVNLWDSEKHERVTLEGHEDAVTCVGFDAAGRRLASGSVDRTVLVWSFATGRVAEVLDGHAGGVRALRWRGDGVRLATAGDDDRLVGLWEPRQLPAPPPPPPPAQTAKTAAGTAATGTTAAGTNTLPLDSRHTASVYAVAWSPDGTSVVSGSWDQTVRLWDVQRPFGACVRSHTDHTNMVYAVACSADGRYVASGSGDAMVHVHAAASGERVAVLEGHAGPVRCLAFGTGTTSSLASGGDDRCVRVWDPDTGAVLRELEGHGSVVYCVAWHPTDPNVLASGSWDTHVIVWLVATGEAASTLLGHADSVRCLAWGQQGSYLYSGAHDSKIRVWGPAASAPGAAEEETPNDSDEAAADVAPAAPQLQLQCVGFLTGHRAGVRALTVSPDGRRLASGSHDCSVRLWCLLTHAALLELPDAHTAPVIALAFSPCGGFLASGSHDATVGLWDCASGADWASTKRLGGGGGGSRPTSQPATRPGSPEHTLLVTTTAAPHATTELQQSF